MDLPGVANCRGTRSGFNLYLETEKKIATFLKAFEEDHMTWLEEILLEARKTFTRRSLTLLPKTPSNAKRNRRIRPNSDDQDGSSSSGSPPTKKRVQRKSKSLDPVDATEAVQCSAPQRATRSTRSSTRGTTQERKTRTTRGKPTKSVCIVETSEESSSEKTEPSLSDNRVKKLINHHEKMITESSDDDFHSPKRLRKFVKKELDTVQEALLQPTEKQNVVKEPVPETETKETIVNESNDSSTTNESIAASPVKELVPSEDPVADAVVSSNESLVSKTDDEVIQIDESNEESTTDSKESSSSEELSEKDVVVQETKDEDSMEEDSLNEGSNTSVQTSSFMLNNVRMSISMSKSKKRSISNRRLSRDSNARQSLRSSKQLSTIAKKIKMESCVEELQDDADERPSTRASVSKHRLSVDTNVRRSVRQSLRVSKRLSAMSQKNTLESCEEKSQDGSDSSNAEEKISAVSKPVQMSVVAPEEVSKSTTESEESSNESSVDFKSATEATPEPQKPTRSCRTKQRKPPPKAALPVTNEIEADGGKQCAGSDVAEKPSPKQKNTRTQTKLRKAKKSSQNVVSEPITVELKTEKRSIGEPVTRKRRSSLPNEEVAKNGKKIRLSHPDKVEVVNLMVEVTRCQSAASENFDDSLEPSSSDEVKAHEAETVAEPKRKSRRKTQDDDPDMGEAVALTAGNDRSCEQDAEKRSQRVAVSSEDSEEDAVERTPSPKCPADKVIRPHPQSFLRRKDEGTCPTNSTGIITSFIKRNTPKKKTLKERQDEIKAQIREKQRKEEEIRKKLQQERKNKMEEQKRKREDRARKAAEARERRILQQNEKRQKLEEFYEHKQLFTEKQKEDRKREDMQKKKILTKKRLEAEERRRVEEDNRKQKLKQQEEEEKRYKEMMSRKREFEEQERLQKQEEWRIQQELRKADQEKQRLEECKKRRELEIENEREQQRIKEQREKERREFERMRIQEAELREREKKAREEAEEQKKIEAERIRREQERKKEREHLKQMMMKEKQQQLEEMPKPKMPLSTNTTALNTTVTKESDMKSPQSYDITPQRIHKPSTEENYCIDDINSDDSTDDEDHPRKTIPSWAQGAALRAHLIHQIRFPVNLDKIFGAIEPPDLTQVFQKKRTRYLKRTSSAVWNSPIFNKY